MQCACWTQDLHFFVREQFSLSELQKLLRVIAAMHTTVVQIHFHRANTEVNSAVLHLRLKRNCQAEWVSLSRKERSPLLWANSLCVPLLFGQCLCVLHRCKNVRNQTESVSQGLIWPINLVSSHLYHCAIWCVCRKRQPRQEFYGGELQIEKGERSRVINQQRRGSW